MARAFPDNVIDAGDVLIVGAGLAAGAVLGRIRLRAGAGRWWPVHLIVLLYLSISAWLVL